MEIPKFDLMDTNNELIILVNMSILIYNGTEWKSILINDIKLPNSGIENLLKPSLCEIYNSKEKKNEKVLILTGGFNLNEKSSSKTTFVLNLNNEKCFLDLKYEDLNYARFMHGSINIKNKFILVFGGKNEKNFVLKNEILDINEKKWKNFPDLISAKANFSYCVINENNLFLYGGFEANGKYCENKLTKCEINVENFEKSVWKNLILKGKNIENLPLACAGMFSNDDNIIICGGTNGKEIIDSIFEINTNDETVEEIGKLKQARSNFHVLMNNENFFLVGGNLKEFKNNNNNEIENYIEKFSFDLNNEIIGNLINVKIDDIFSDLKMKDKINYFKNEPGFSFCASLMSKNN
jgi:hypothetical protein